MEYPEVKQLLEKYWNAETSLEEEAALTAYFNQEQVPPDLEVYRDLFAWYAIQQATVPDVALEEKIREQVREESSSGIPVVRKMTGLWMRIAAVIVLSVGIAAIYRYTNRPSSSQPATVSKTSAMGMADTYEDPQKAMAEVKKALLLVSGHLHKGEEITQNKLTNLKTLGKVVQ